MASALLGGRTHACSKHRRAGSGTNVLQKAAQKALRLQARDEWAFLFGGGSGGSHLTEMLHSGRSVPWCGKGDHPVGEKEQDDDLPAGTAPGALSQGQPNACAPTWKRRVSSTMPSSRHQPTPLAPDAG